VTNLSIAIILSSQNYWISFKLSGQIGYEVLPKNTNRLTDNSKRRKRGCRSLSGRGNAVACSEAISGLCGKQTLPPLGLPKSHEAFFLGWTIGISRIQNSTKPDNGIPASFRPHTLIADWPLIDRWAIAAL